MDERMMILSILVNNPTYLGLDMDLIRDRDLLILTQEQALFLYQKEQALNSESEV